MPKAPRTADVARRLVDAYVTSLRQHLPTYCIRQLDKLPGAQEHQLARLRQSYPGAPTELLYFLRRVNGTCWESLTSPPGSTPLATAVGMSTERAAAAAAVAATQPPVAAAAPSSDAATERASVSANAPPESGKGAKTTLATAADPTATTTTATPKPGVKATAAAASIASEAAAFIKSTLTKKASGGAASTRPRRLPQYVALPILGSAYTSCPYYLKSVEQMLQAEQQFPPPSANLPDEGEAWVPPASTPPPSGATATAGSSTAIVTSESTPAGPAKEGGLADAVAAATSAGLNQNTIGSVFAAYRIIYGVPPLPGAGRTAGAGVNETPSVSTTPPSTTEAASVDLANTPTSASLPKCEGEEKVVYVDPRIDINAGFYHWLVFADSVQPHVRGQAPAIPDADPAKIAAAAATTSGDAEKAPSGTGTSPIAAAAAAAAAAVAPVRVFAPSRLYIDFKPVEAQGGVYGQVIQFVHGPPSSFTVVANDFGSYLKYIMSEEFEFTEELEDDEDDEEEEEGVDLVTPVPPKANGSEDSRVTAAAATKPPQ